MEKLQNKTKIMSKTTWKKVQLEHTKMWQFWVEHSTPKCLAASPRSYKTYMSLTSIMHQCKSGLFDKLPSSHQPKLLSHFEMQRKTICKLALLKKKEERKVRKKKFSPASLLMQNSKFRLQTKGSHVREQKLMSYYSFWQYA